MVKPGNWPKRKNNLLVMKSSLRTGKSPFVDELYNSPLKWWLSSPRLCWIKRGLQRLIDYQPNFKTCLRHFAAEPSLCVSRCYKELRALRPLYRPILQILSTASELKESDSGLTWLKIQRSCRDLKFRKTTAIKSDATLSRASQIATDSWD